MSSQAQQDLLHILVVPFQQQGHINGMLGLSQALVTIHEGVVVTFGYPARFHSLALKHNKLSALNVSAQQKSLLRIEVLDDGLPPDEEQGLTGEHLMASIPTYQRSVKLLFDRLLLHSKLQPGDDELTYAGAPLEYAQLPALSCIISDNFLPWTQDLADTARLPRVDFMTSSAAVYSMGTQLSRLVSKGVLPLPKSCWANVDRPWKLKEPLLIEGVPGLPPFPATEFFAIMQFADASFLQFMINVFRPAKLAHTILVHSVYELESCVFDALQANGFPAYAVGPFLHQVNAPTARHECLEWLDTQAPASVIYIALGTVAKLDPAEIHALAFGLEASKHPFLWVIRTDSISSSLEDALPDGFLQRTRLHASDSGRIISWAPQTEVLRHRSIGAFLSHCGWNSTIECMWEGVPMVACPRQAEQRSNARWIVDNWKVGVELERQDDGSFTKEAVQHALQDVLSEGSQYKERAVHAKQVARSAVQQNGSSSANLISFLQRLRRGSYN